MKRKKRGNNFWKENLVYDGFKYSLKYTRDSKNYIFFGLFLFLISISLGYAFPKLFEEQLIQMIKELLQQTIGLDAFGMIKFIVFNNVKSSFFGLFFGLLFGILPMVMIVVNGFLLGFVATRAVSSDGILVLWKLFPHGIFEIPAVIISVGIGLRLGLFLFSIKNKTKGFAAFVISLVCFFFLFSFFSVILSLFLHSANPVDLQNNYSLLMKNPVFFTFYLALMFFFFALSSYLSLYIFLKKERVLIIKDYFFNIRSAIIVFVFLIIPLLVIAGIIEGSLISWVK